MLNVTRDILSKLDDDVLVKQRRFLKFLACLMFLGGILFILFPYVSGGVLSIIVGVILMCSGVALAIGMFKNRVHNFWPVVSGVVISIAYFLMGYFSCKARTAWYRTLRSYLLKESFSFAMRLSC